MSSIAVQTKVGAINSKATTELSWNFDSICKTVGFQFGCNSQGIYLLNVVDSSLTPKIERSFTLATSSLGTSNAKHLRFLYINIITDKPFIVTTIYDDKHSKSYTAKTKKTGLQKVLVPISRTPQGTYISLTISSTHFFKIDSIKGLYYSRPQRIRGFK